MNYPLTIPRMNHQVNIEKGHRKFVDLPIRNGDLSIRDVLRPL